MNLENIKIGDVIIGKEMFYNEGVFWNHKYKVLAIDPISTRFGKPDRILTVEISTSDNVIVDYETGRWVSQLF